MKFNTPNTSNKYVKNFISDKISMSICKGNDYQSVISLSRIPANEIILIEYPYITLYGENNIDRGLQTIKKYILMDTKMDTNMDTNMDTKMDTQLAKYNNCVSNNSSIANLYPRVKDKYIFPRTELIKQIHKIIKNIENKRLQDFFNKYTKNDIEYYYAKYIFNAFEGYEYGPLTMLYLAKFNHSCNNNISFNFDPYIGAIVAKTICNIESNSELFISYLSNKKIHNHKEYLYNHYGFNADCKCNK